jgi:hypothetical protein
VTLLQTAAAEHTLARSRGDRCDRCDRVDGRPNDLCRGSDMSGLSCRLADAAARCGNNMRGGQQAQCWNETVDGGLALA